MTTPQSTTVERTAETPSQIVSIEKERATEFLNQTLREFLTVDCGLKNCAAKFYADVELEYTRHANILRRKHQEAMTAIHSMTVVS